MRHNFRVKSIQSLLCMLWVLFPDIVYFINCLRSLALDTNHHANEKKECASWKNNLERWMIIIKFINCVVGDEKDTNKNQGPSLANCQAIFLKNLNLPWKRPDLFINLKPLELINVLRYFPSLVGLNGNTVSFKIWVNINIWISIVKEPLRRF